MKSARQLLAAALLLAGCDANDAPPAPPRPAGPVEVTSETEPGFHDLVFTIVQRGKTLEGGRSLQAAGMYKGTRVGFTATLGAQWKKGDSKGAPIVPYTGSVVYKSNGPESDAFVKALDALYGTTLNPEAMAGETRFAAIALQGNPSELERGETRIKLFYEAKDVYAEHFLAIDLKAGKLWVREKDEEYRKPLVQALGRR